MKKTIKRAKQKKSFVRNGDNGSEKAFHIIHLPLGLFLSSGINKKKSSALYFF